jgi:2-dehydropantoate 2-reductase
MRVEEDMRHAILGAGGVGGLIGAGLAKSGDAVTLVVRAETLKDYPAELSLESPFGSFSVPVDRASNVAKPYDVLWIAVKATQLDTALHSLVVSPEALGAVIPLLNGIDHIEVLRSRLGHDRVVPASIAVESERIAPGKIVHRSPGARLVLSSMGESRLASTIEKFRQFGFTCQFSADEQRILWSKLAFLGPCALTTTASGLAAGEMRRDPVWRTRFDDCVHETCSVSTASGTPLEPAGFIHFLDTLQPGMRSSMQKDVAAGNPPELDAIAGPILRGAEKHGLQVPVTQELVEMIRGKSTTAIRG